MNKQMRVLRERRGWTQEALARKTGLSRVSINEIENGVTQPGPHAAIRIAQALGHEGDPATLFPQAHWTILFEAARARTNLVARLREAGRRPVVRAVLVEKQARRANQAVREAQAKLSQIRALLGGADSAVETFRRCYRQGR